MSFASIETQFTNGLKVSDERPYQIVARWVSHEAVSDSSPLGVASPLLGVLWHLFLFLCSLCLP